MYWLKGVAWKQVLLSSAIFLIIATIVRQIEVFLTMDFYKMPEYFGIWSKLMMPKAGPPPAEFMVVSLLFTWLTGLTLALLYNFIKDLLSKSFWGRVGGFVDVVISLSIVFFTLPAYLLFNLPGTLLLIWTMSSILIFFLATLVFAKLIKS